MVEYTLIRSARRTLAIQILPDGEVVVRAPRRCGQEYIEGFVAQKQDWILRKQKEIRQRAARLEQEQAQQRKLTPEEYTRLQESAGQAVLAAVKRYAPLMQVSVSRITIRDQKTRWGSCSAKGNLNFNWRLILAPEHVLDYVVVHELAHRREMNHSPRFWALVEEMIPDYKDCRKWLRQHGDELMSR